jgi:hypothetical protein
MKRRSKYGAKPTTIRHAGKDIRCASLAEAKRFGELILLLRARKIDHLEFHPSYPLVVEGKKVATYIADAKYLDLEVGQYVIEDTKGMQTPVFKLKAKLFEAIYGQPIKLVKA